MGVRSHGTPCEADWAIDFRGSRASYTDSQEIWRGRGWQRPPAARISHPRWFSGAHSARVSPSRLSIAIGFTTDGARRLTRDPDPDATTASRDGPARLPPPRHPRP